MFCPFCSIFIFLCNVVFSFVFLLLLLLLAASTLYDRFAQSLVSCIVFCRSLFVLLSLLFWSSYCLFFFDLLPLITSLVFSNCPCMNPKYVRGIMKKNLHIYKWKYYQHKHIYTCIKIRNESSLIGFAIPDYYHWDDDASAGVPGGIILQVVSVSALTWIIRCIYYWNELFLYIVYQASSVFADFGYPV